jgi:hypothetical protein
MGVTPFPHSYKLFSQYLFHIIAFLACSYLVWYEHAHIMTIFQTYLLYRSSEACLLSFEGINSHSVQCFDIMVVIIWLLDLQPPMQSVPMATKVVSFNPTHGEVYSIQHYVIKFVSDLQQSVIFSMYSCFLNQ